MPKPTGQPFGKYELQDRIAAGGMAEIYRARYRAAAGITKPVVIKKILPHYAGNGSFIKMFMDEAQIVVGLSHGNIAQVFDFGEIDGEYFLAMEWVHGQALSKIIRRAREQQIAAIPTPFAVYVAMEMCKGLHYAHTRLDERNRPLNIVHRDVSPQNVIVSYDGQVKLVDFGIAKARTAGRTETEAGAIKGKYVYFSPEQARGKEIDARTDVFATGVVLYEMLCGRLPFEGKMMDVLSKIVRCEFPRPRSLNPEISPALERILLTAMAADRKDRYESAQAFQEALAGYLYANAPTFSGASLANFVGYLYEPELVDQGSPVKLPRDFLEQVPLWKKALPASKFASPDSSASSTRETAAGRSRRSSQVKSSQQETRAAPGTAPKLAAPERAKTSAALQSKWLLAAVPLLAAALAAAVVYFAGSAGSFSIQLTSSPPGATVSVDGAPGQLTPVLISHLPADRSHVLLVSAPGMKPWTKVVAPVRGVTVPVNAVLEPEHPVPPPSPAVAEPVKQPAEPTVVAETPKVSDVRYTLTYPIGSFALKPRHHTLLVPPSKAARVKLDPDKTYTVWAEGKASLGGYVDVMFFDEVFFYAEGTDELPADDAFGELGRGRRHAKTIRHATALYGFIFDERPYDNSGAIKIRIQARGEKKITTLLVDAKANALFPEEMQAVALTGLSTVDTYEVVIRPGNEPPSTRPGRHGRTTKVVMVQNSAQLFMQSLPQDDWERVVEVDKKVQVRAAEYLRFFFLDDSVEDNAGDLVVEVSPVAGNGGALGGLKSLFNANGGRAP